MARAMEHQPALLLGRLDWHKPHIGSCDRLTDGLPSMGCSIVEALSRDPEGQRADQQAYEITVQLGYGSVAVRA